jgi:hypothetical protein
LARFLGPRDAGAGRRLGQMHDRTDPLQFRARFAAQPRDRPAGDEEVLALDPAVAPLGALGLILGALAAPNQL